MATEPTAAPAGCGTRISTLLEELGGGSRKSKFSLEISWNGLNSRKMDMLCKSASFPNLDISTTDVSYRGYKYHLRAEAEYPSTYEVTILDDASMSLRKFFDDWMTSISNPFSYNTAAGDASSEMPITGAYTTEINIWQLDGEGNKVYGYKLHDAYPTSIGAVSYESGSQNELVEYSVTFTFNEFTPIK